MTEVDPARVDEVLAAARALVKAVERLAQAAPLPAGRRPEVVSPPCPIHADELASRCGRCLAEAAPPPVDLLAELQRSVDRARAQRKDHS